MRAITFPNATRLTVVYPDGTVTDKYNAFYGLEVHIQDEGRTVKIFPKEEE